MFRLPWLKKPWLTVLFLGPAVLCSCMQPAPNLVPPSGAETPLQAKQGVDPSAPNAQSANSGLQYFLVEEGESSQAIYNASGDKILFVSRLRPDHAHDQVYEKDLNSGTERRITYQNGSTFQPQYQGKENWIIYSSSTDELKENPPLLLLHPATIPSQLPYPYQEPMEIYLHSLHGFDIRRLTMHTGFDGEARISSDGKSITFTRVSDAKTQIMLLEPSTRLLKGVRLAATNPSQFVTSADGKFRAWLDWDANYAATKLRLQSGNASPIDVTTSVAALPAPDISASDVRASDIRAPGPSAGATFAAANKNDLSFSPDSKWLLWSQANPDHAQEIHDLWAVNLQTLCTFRLIQGGEGIDLPPADLRYATISPDMKWLTYTYVTKERSRIARRGFAPPTGPCTPAPKVLK